jgi:branched-chain amino acid transport system substrate-binding protein
MNCLTRCLGGLALCAGLLAGIVSAAGAEEPVRIGVIEPIKSVVGQQSLDGIGLAAEMINEDGGILGKRRIELVTYDTNFSPPDGVAAVQRLLTQDGIRVVVGEISSSVALAAIPIFEAEDAVFVAAVPKHPDVTRSGYDKVFRMNSTSRQDADAFGAYLQEKVRPQKVGILAENSDFGLASVDQLKDLFGDRMIFTDTFAIQQSDFSSLVANVKASGADLVCIAAANVEQYGNILRMLAEAGYNGGRCLLPGVLNSAGVEIAGAAAEGSVGADIYLWPIDTPFNHRFVERFEAKFGRKPQKVELLGFESLWIAARAMDAAGTDSDTAAIAAAIRAGKWETPRGTETFDADGQASSGAVLPLIVRSGEIVIDAN